MGNRAGRGGGGVGWGRTRLGAQRAVHSLEAKFRTDHCASRRYSRARRRKVSHTIGCYSLRVRVASAAQ